MSRSPLLITIEEAAQMMGISRSHAYEAIVAAGLLPVVRIGRTARVRVCDVEALVDQLARGEVEVP